MWIFKGHSDNNSKFQMCIYVNPETLVLRNLSHLETYIHTYKDTQTHTHTVIAVSFAIAITWR